MVVTRREFPLLKYLDLRAQEEKRPVSDVIARERDYVSCGWGTFDDKGGYPHMPPGVNVPKSERQQFLQLAGCGAQFGGAVIASLVHHGLATHPELARTISLTLGK
ncbi:MAG: hypothetical protein ACYCW6_08025 [Candidatus Xenobia bacterium]